MQHGLVRQVERLHCQNEPHHHSKHRRDEEACDEILANSTQPIVIFSFRYGLFGWLFASFACFVSFTPFAFLRLLRGLHGFHRADLGFDVASDADCTVQAEWARYEHVRAHKYVAARYSGMLAAAVHLYAND